VYSYVPEITKCVVLVAMTDRYEVRVILNDDIPLGLAIHTGERDKTLRRTMKKAGGTVVRHGRICAFDTQSIQLAKNLQKHLWADLGRIARKPINQRNVERLLAITSAERIRWTKDGRLPVSGTSQIQRGQKIVLWTYPPGRIERLMARPELIAGWRTEDAIKNRNQEGENA
jgi:hypothetical protein